MKYKSYKGIIFFVSLVFIASCNQQPSAEDKTAPGKEANTEVAMPEENTDDDMHLSARTFDDDSVELSLTNEAANTVPVADKELSAIFGKGTNAYASDDFATGVTYFEQIVRDHPENRKAYYNLGVGYFKLERFYDALQAFSKAIEIIPNDAISIQYRGRVYYMMGNYEKALEDYNRVIDLKDSDPIAWYNRGTAHGALKLYRNAKQDFDKAIELDPDYALAFFNRGLANYFLGMRHEACADWRKAHALGHYEAEKALRSYCEDN